MEKEEKNTIKSKEILFIVQASNSWLILQKTAATGLLSLMIKHKKLIKAE